MGNVVYRLVRRMKLRFCSDNKTALLQRTVFPNRHSKIKLDWQDDRLYRQNNDSRVGVWRILWKQCCFYVFIPPPCVRNKMLSLKGKQINFSSFAESLFGWSYFFLSFLFLMELKKICLFMFKLWTYNKRSDFIPSMSCYMQPFKQSRQKTKGSGINIDFNLILSCII